MNIINYTLQHIFSDKMSDLFLKTVSNIPLSAISENPNCPTDKLSNCSVIVHRFASPILVAQAITFLPIYIPDPSDSDPLPFPNSHPVFTEALARKSISFRLRKSLDFSFTFYVKPITPILRNEIDEPSITVSTPRKSPFLKTASDLRPETCSVLYLILPPVFYPHPLLMTL